MKLSSMAAFIIHQKWWFAVFYINGSLVSPSVYPINIQNPNLIITMPVDVTACNSVLAISWHNDDCEVMRYTVQCCYNLLIFTRIIEIGTP